MQANVSSPDDTGEELQFDNLMRIGPEASAAAPVRCVCMYRDVPGVIGQTPGCAVRAAQASGMDASCWNREGTTASCSTSQGWRK